MECKRVVCLMMMMLMAMLGVLPSTDAHLPPGACIKHCMKDCKLSSIGVPICVKYCPVHCLPPDNSKKERYCNLKCMLDTCSKFTDDEKKMTDCVFSCGKHHCRAGS